MFLLPCVDELNVASSGGLLHAIEMDATKIHRSFDLMCPP